MAKKTMVGTQVSASFTVEQNLTERLQKPTQIVIPVLVVLSSAGNFLCKGPMVEYDLIQAVQEWLRGDLNPKDQMYGLRIFWWGRIGMAFGFFGALTVVTELIGYTRIKGFGDALPNLSFKDAITFATLGLRVVFYLGKK
ncbi:MAG: hypothetical protein IH872_12370 [Chloroflexi bacterium]|nr:hypothetical protein [Chloroflexota bacterium]